MSVRHLATLGAALLALVFVTGCGEKTESGGTTPAANAPVDNTTQAPQTAGASASTE